MFDILWVILEKRPFFLCLKGIEIVDLWIRSEIVLAGVDPIYQTTCLIIGPIT